MALYFKTAKTEGNFEETRHARKMASAMTCHYINAK